MSLSDSIADFLTRVRNAQSSRLSVVKVSCSGMNRSILTILQNEGYILGFSEDMNDTLQPKDSGGKPKVKFLEVGLKYYLGRPVVSYLVRVSTPGKRVYSSLSKIPKLRNGLGVYILSTSRGVLSDSEARKLGVGGEILCGVF